MSEYVTSQAAIPLPATRSLSVSAERIAQRMLRAIGGHAGFISLVGNAGSTPRLLIAVGSDQTPAVRSKDISLVLRRARGRTAPFEVEVAGQRALVLPLIAEANQIGAAIIFFRDGLLIANDQAMAAAELAADALTAAQQLVLIQLQAEELAERARVREIQVSRNLIRGVIDSIPLGLVLIDADSTVLAANRALSDRVGLDPAALVGMHYGAAIGGWNESPAGQTFASGQSLRVRRAIQRGDGGQTLVEISSFALLDADDRPRQVVEVWEDITERVSLQTQLVRAEKLAAIGQLAASIAHEVGNPLQAIQGFLSLFLEQCEPETPNRRFLELAEDEIDRIVQVINRLRDLYRPRADIIASVNINELVDGILLLTNKQMERHNVRIERVMDSTLPLVACVADQIKQVLLNLMLNAIDAMKGGGVLVVQTKMSQAGVDIIIADTGVGISADQLSHIFDGLHTTKDRGMGLGLYTSKAIIERHMGSISVASSVGAGTTFTITLPLEA